MKKKLKFIVPLTIVFLFVCFFFIKINPRELTTDSGFDSSFDGGSDFGGSDFGGSDYGGSSSWDSGSRRSSGLRNGSIDADVLLIILFSFVFFLFYVLFAFDKQSAGRISYISSYNLSSYGLNKKEVVNRINELLMNYQKNHFIENKEITDDYFSSEASESLEELKNDIDFSKVKEIKNIDSFIFTTIKYKSALKITMELFFEYIGTSGNNIIKKFIVDIYYDNDYFIYKIKLYDVDDLGDISSVRQSTVQTIDDKLDKIGYDKYGLLEKAYNIYLDVQKAWMNDTLDEVKNIISDDMYNQYSSQLATLRVKKQQNVMSDFKYVDSYIISVREDKNALYFKVFLCVTCKDYLIEKNNQKVIRGSEKRINTYRYSLTFRFCKESADTCPNCGAKIKSEDSSVKCEYCGSNITRLSKNMVLTDKKMISQS